MEIQQVNALPELNQADFPALPQIPPGKHLVCYGTEFKNAEMEWAAGSIVNVCMKAGEWIPVPIKNFLDELTGNPFIPPQYYKRIITVYTLRVFIETGDIKVIRHQDETYIIPTPGLANTVLCNPEKLRFV